MCSYGQGGSACQSIPSTCSGGLLQFQALLVDLSGKLCGGEIEVWIDETQKTLNWSAIDQIASGSGCVDVGSARGGTLAAPQTCCDATFDVPFSSMILRVQVQKDWLQ